VSARNIRERILQYACRGERNLGSQPVASIASESGYDLLLGEFSSFSLDGFHSRCFLALNAFVVQGSDYPSNPSIPKDSIPNAICSAVSTINPQHVGVYFKRQGPVNIVTVKSFILYTSLLKKYIGSGRSIALFIKDCQKLFAQITREKWPSYVDSFCLLKILIKTQVCALHFPRSLS